MTSPIEFSPERALGYARSLARPRLVGSRGERLVAREIVTRLERFGFQVDQQPVHFSTAVNAFVRLEVVAGQLLILLTIGLWEASPWLASLPAGLLLALVFFIERINRSVESAAVAGGSVGPRSVLEALAGRLGRKYRTANLVARLPGQTDGGQLPELVLMAHYDSKSQFMPIHVRAALFAILAAGAVAFAGLTVLRVAAPGVTSLAAICGLAVLLAGVPLVFLDLSDYSPGAVDNASGVGLVLHLAEYLSGDTSWRSRLGLTVLLTGAEEMALMGSAGYLRAHESELSRQAAGRGLHILNVDGIGAGGRLFVAGPGGELASALRQASAQLRYPLGRLALFGVLFDHLPFSRRGFDAVSLTAIGPGSLTVHTRNDSADKLRLEGFRQGGEIVLGVIERLAQP